jgi:hypothetical protein
VLTSFALAGASYLFTWSLLAALLVLLWTFLAPAVSTRSWPRAVALALASVPTIVLATPPVYLLFALLTHTEPFLGLPIGGAPVVLVALAFGALLPALFLLAGRRAWLVPTMAALAGLLTLGYGTITSGFDANHPRPTSIAYVLDADSGSATWVTADADLGGWIRQFFPDRAQPGGFRAFPNSNPDTVFPAWQTPAPLVALPAPEIAVLDDSVIGTERTVRLRATSPRGASNLYVDVQAPGDITSAKLDGRPLDRINIPGDQRTRLRLAYHAIPTEGIQLELTLSASGPLRVQLEDRSNGLPDIPGIASVPRPAEEMMAPFEMADPTVVMRSLVLSD